MKRAPVACRKNRKVEFSVEFEKISDWLLTETGACAYRDRMLVKLISLQIEVRAQVAFGFMAARA